MQRIGPYDLELVCDRLRRFAAEYQAGGATARYVLANGALVNERVVHADAGLMMRTLSQHRRLHVVDLPFTAERVLIKNNIAIIGLGERGELVARVQMRREKRGSPIRREVRARRIFSAMLTRSSVPGHGFGIPAVVQIDPAMNWLIEERATGVMPGPSEVEVFLRRYAANFYGPTLRFAPLRPLDGPEALFAEVRRLVPDIPMQFLRGPVAFSLCHGDLNITNLLYARPGYFSLVDLERARLMPVAIDVAKPLVQFPGLAYAVLAVLEQLPAEQSGERPLSPPLQLLLGVAHHSIRHQASFDVHMADQVRLFRRSREEALAMHRRISDSIQRIAEEMLRRCKDAAA
jgi:hypothetical protein